MDILCVYETTLDASYQNAQFHIDENLFPPFRRDRYKHGGGKIVFVQKGEREWEDMHISRGERQWDDIHRGYYL